MVVQMPDIHASCVCLFGVTDDDDDDILYFRAFKHSCTRSRFQHNPNSTFQTTEQARVAISAFCIQFHAFIFKMILKSPRIRAMFWKPIQQWFPFHLHGGYHAVFSTNLTKAKRVLCNCWLPMMLGNSYHISASMENGYKNDDDDDDDDDDDNESMIIGVGNSNNLMYLECHATN